MPLDKEYINDVVKLIPHLIESIPHANYLTHLRYKGTKTKKKGQITGDFPMFLNTGGKVAFYLTKRNRNLILRHLEDAVEQLDENGFYRPEDTERDEIVNSVGIRSSVICVDLEELSLKVRKTHGYAYFSIFPNKTNELSEQRLLVAKTAFGYGERFEQAIKMLKDYKIRETRMFFPSLRYVLENTDKGEAIAMVCRLNSLDGYSSVHFNYRNVNNLILELGGMVRKIMNQEVHESPLPKILDILLSPDSDYPLQQREKLAMGLQSTVTMYFQTRAEDAAKTTGKGTLIAKKAAVDFMSNIKTENRLVAEVLDLLISPNSRYSRSRKDRLAVILQGCLYNFYDQRAHQFTKLVKSSSLSSE